jgi:signal transduction histidine kinase
LLEVSRRQTSHRDVFTLNEVALLLRAEMETSARAHGFSLAFDLADDAAAVRGSIDRVAQALRNVWTNAIEHAAAGDVIRVSTRNVTTRGAAATEIAVEDSGAGIPTEILERVFEPFVTTKTGTENRAAGLGLSLVFRIVQDHGGEVSIVCGNPVGTTVRLDFPAIVAGGRNVGADR